MTVSVDEAAGGGGGASGLPESASWPVAAIAGTVGGGVAPQVPSRLASSRFPPPGRAPGADLAALVAGSAPVSLPIDRRQPEGPALEVMEMGERAGVVAFQRAARSDNTLAAYRADWHRFSQWCTRHGVAALPAEPAVVAAYVAEAANTAASTGRSVPWAFSPATLARWIATINKAHDLFRALAPGKSPAVRDTMAGIRRSRATPPKRKTPLLLADLENLIKTVEVTGWPGTPGALRNRCLLVMGWVGAFRRSELANLTVDDVTLHADDGLHVMVRQSKTDPEAQGRTYALPYARQAPLCAPCAWLRWRQVLDAFDGIDGGPGGRAGVMRACRGLRVDAHVCRTSQPATRPAGECSKSLFRAVKANGTVGGPIDGHAVTAVVKAAAAACGFDPARIGGHSLRAGFVTQAFRSGADTHAIMRQTGHADPKTLEIYARESAPLVGNAVTRSDYDTRNDRGRRSALGAVRRLVHRHRHLVPAGHARNHPRLPRRAARRPATIRRRIGAVDAAHRSAGHPPPSASPAFDALLRPSRPPRFAHDLVATALAIIPVGGWPVGIVGRRDAAVVALICTAGLTRRQTQALQTSPATTQGEEQRGAGTAGESGLPAVVATAHPGACPACALTRWQWVAAMTAAAGWRTVRGHVADLGETTAADETSHDCTRPAGEPDLSDDDQWVLGRRLVDCRPVPLFCAIDRHGTPQTGYPLSTRSMTTIVAARLAAAVYADRRPSTTFPDCPGPPATWGSDDHARVVAARHAATDRLASFEADLDEADAYAEAILARLDAELSGESD